MLQGLLPLRRDQVPGDLLAGVTLAALGIPEVLGYARIAGMPVVTGLYTLLLPMALFAVFGASRHLVVAADSATAAIMAAALVRLADPGSAQYIRLAGLAALLTGALLLLARLARLGFLASFLSRTVLLGFLTGVGIQVAIGQLPDMLGVTASSSNTLVKLGETVAALPQAQGLTVAVSLGVVAVMMGARRITRRIPGALIAVVGAIIISRVAHLAAHGVSVLGYVPRGLPAFGLPAFGLHNTLALLGTSASIFLVILAQSAATARAYAAKYGEPFSTDTDLVGLGAGNIAAAFTGTFVVNGSPTKTQIVDDAGGRSQVASLTTSALALVVLLVATGPLSYLPTPALAAVVFLIGAELVDIRGIRRVLRVRRTEFAVAVITAAAVVGLSISGGIVVAVVASIIDHLRHSYHPRNTRAGEVGRRALADHAGHPGRPHRARPGHLPLRHQPVLRERVPAGGRPHGDHRPGRPHPLVRPRRRGHRRRGLHRVLGPQRHDHATAPAAYPVRGDQPADAGAPAARALRDQRRRRPGRLLRHAR